MRHSKCPICGYWAFNGEECFDCGYRPRAYQDLVRRLRSPWRRVLKQSLRPAVLVGIALLIG